jgi:hypothetical protein
MFFNENLNRFYPFDSVFVGNHRSEYTTEQIELLRSGIIDFGLVFYSNKQNVNLWTNGILENADNFIPVESPPPPVKLINVQNNRITVEVDDTTLTFDFTDAADFVTQIVYFTKGYAFLTAGRVSQLFNTAFDPAVEIDSERIVVTADNKLTSINGITDKTVVVSAGKNCNCYAENNNIFVTAVNRNEMPVSIDGLVTFLGAKGKNIGINTCPELTAVCESNVITISVNEDMFNRLNCNGY